VPGGLKIPGLCLQPLLENAIYHGIQKLPDGGTVTVSGNCHDGMLRLVVTNPVPGKVEPNQQGNQIAQLNIQQRLQAIYGPRAGLQSSCQHNIHRVEIFYPVSLQEVGS
jgi:two-component system sensor histidine kinase AlgZ